MRTSKTKGHFTQNTNEDPNIIQYLWKYSNNRYTDNNKKYKYIFLYVYMYIASAILHHVSITFVCSEMLLLSYYKNTSRWASG